MDQEIKNYAVIKDGIVINNIVAYDLETAQLVSGETCVEYTFDNPSHIGLAYYADLNVFLQPKPFPSWTLNEETARWEPPTPKPDGDYLWDEPTTSWIEVTE